MILYGINLMPLVEHLCWLNSFILQPCYAENFTMEGPSLCIPALFTPMPERAKLWLLPHPHQKLGHLPAHMCLSPLHAKSSRTPPSQGRFSQDQHYVGGFIGSTASHECWLCPMMDAWVHGINSLASIATRFPHSAYARLISCLMAEW